MLQDLFHFHEQGQEVVADKIVAVREGFHRTIALQECLGFEETVAGCEPGLELPAFFIRIKGIEENIIRIPRQDVIHIVLEMHGAFLMGDMGINNAQEIEKTQPRIKGNDSRLLSCIKRTFGNIVLHPKPDPDMRMIKRAGFDGIDYRAGEASLLNKGKEEENHKENAEGIPKAKERIAGIQEFKGVEQSLLKEKKEGYKNRDHKSRKRHPVASAKDDEKDLSGDQESG